MQEREITPVILCGGRGTRLWPRSRAGIPKPLLALIGDDTLLQQTIERSRGPRFASPIIVTGADHVALVRKQLGEAEFREIIVEPEPKETAAAIALAAARVTPDTLLLVCPSDHHFDDPARFREAACAAADVAANGWLVCLAVPATSAATGFGYIQRGSPLAEGGFRARRFIEKPRVEAAEEYLKCGDFAWNTGVFAFTAGNYLKELERHRPALAADVAAAARDGQMDGPLFHPQPSQFAAIEPESVDYAVMENTDRAAMVMVEAGWSDLGDWRSLHRARASDGSANSVRGPAELVDCTNVLVDTDGPRVHALGLSDVIVVVDGDDILVAAIGGAQDVANLAAARGR